jgi:hypothetical protein
MLLAEELEVELDQIQVQQTWRLGSGAIDLPFDH